MKHGLRTMVAACGLMLCLGGALGCGGSETPGDICTDPGDPDCNGRGPDGQGGTAGEGGTAGAGGFGGSVGPVGGAGGNGEAGGSGGEGGSELECELHTWCHSLCEGCIRRHDKALILECEKHCVEDEVCRDVDLKGGWAPLIKYCGDRHQ